MPIKKNICRACMTSCPKDKVLFVTLKDVFRELTSLQVEDDSGLPKYLCKNCGDLLLQFESFKKTCIASDKLHRDDLSSLPVPLELIKIENRVYDDESLPLELPKLKSKPNLEVTRKSPRVKPSTESHSLKQEKQTKNLKRRVLSPVESDDHDSTTMQDDHAGNTESSDEVLNEPSTASRKRTLICTVPDCRSRFISQLRLDVHMKAHQGIDCTICDICEKPLTSLYHMVNHRLTHRSIEERSLKCTVCRKIFMRERSYKQHIAMHANDPAPKKSAKKNKRDLSQEAHDDADHGLESENSESSDDGDEEWEDAFRSEVTPTIISGDKPVAKRQYMCTVKKCNSKFRTEIMLETHMKTHQGIDCTICDICERPLTSMTHMLSHRETHKSAEERAFKCSVCNKIVSSARSLKNHMKLHDTSRPFVCDVCGKGFTIGWHLNNHRKTHTTERNFRCDQCPSAFKTSLQLYVHGSKVHGKSKPAKCDICGYVATSKNVLFTHCRHMHTVYTTTENIYQCKLCHVKCKTLVNLKMHERLHTGERKYKCTLCSKSYAYLELLKRHSHIHTGELPYECNECGKKLSSKWSLKVHFEMHKKNWLAMGRPGITLMKKKVVTMESEDSLDNFAGDCM